MSASSRRPVITLLTDYGTTDEFVGVLHGVIAMICPDARVIDLTHGIGRHDIRGGATVLAQSLPYLPVGVHVAVVDPDGRRRPSRGRAAAGRRAHARRTGQRAAVAGLPGSRRASSRRSRSRSPPGDSSRSPQPSTGATSSRRSPRTSPPGSRLTRPVSRSTQRVLVRLGGTAGPDRGRRAARDSNQLRPLRQRAARSRRRGHLRAGESSSATSCACGCRRASRARPHTRSRSATWPRAT